MVLALVADTAAVLVAALFYGVASLALLGVTAGVAQSLAKLALDSTIQRDVPERVQSSAFARSDTTLQLAWVLGGFIGIAIPLMPRLGLSVAAAVLAAWFAFVLTTRPRDVHARLEPAQSSSSSANARSSLAVGLAVLGSGWRPWR